MLELRDPTVVDAEGRRTESVVVGDGTFANPDEISAAVVDESIDLSGTYLAPGLVDAHVHLMMDGRPVRRTRYTERESTATLAYRITRNLRTVLERGVTALRDLGAQGSIAIDAAEAVREGTIEGPRVRACGHPVAITGGHAHYMCTEIDGEADARAATRAQLKRGATAIKCMASGGNLFGESVRGPPELEPDELRAIVRTAHAKNVPVAAHAHGDEAIRRAVRAGVDSVEHGTLMTAETADLMAERDVDWVPTRSAVTAFARADESAAFPDEVRARASAVDREFEDAFRHALDAGVTVTMGTDAGTANNPFSAIPAELELLVEHGLTPSQALEAATINAAELLQLPDTGLIQPGWRADCVVLPRDPTVDPTAWQDPKLVVANGDVVADHGDLLT
jgi:imidazolonepropionase-like amidohydrolase